MSFSSRKALAAAGVAGLAIVLAACANKPVVPQPGEYAFVVGGGSSSNQNLHYIINPGVHIKVSNGDRVVYVPGGVRNFVTGKPGGDVTVDRTDPTPSYTKGESGVKPIQVLTYSHVVFELNPNHAALYKFYNTLCTKYGCGSLTPDTSNQNNSLKLSSPKGWLDMVHENFNTAVDNAVRDASATFGPDLWHDTGKWNDFGGAVARFLPRELRLVTGSGADNYFCGANSTPADCKPFAVLVNDVVPVDGAITQQYSQANESDLQGQIAASRAAVARKLYGDQWGYWTGVFQAIQQCKQAGANCTFVIGNPNSIPTSK